MVRQKKIWFEFELLLATPNVSTPALPSRSLVTNIRWVLRLSERSELLSSSVICILRTSLRRDRSSARYGAIRNNFYRQQAGGVNDGREAVGR